MFSKALVGATAMLALAADRIGQTTPRIWQNLFRCSLSLFLLVGFLLVGAASAQFPNGRLPDGKFLPQDSGITVNSMPTAIVVTQDGRYAITLNNGYGTQESGLSESIAVLDLRTGAVEDFPDDRLKQNAKQSYFLGLALSADGKQIYASMSSMSDAEGTEPGSTGNGIAIYSFDQGKVARAGFLKIPLQSLAEGKTATKLDDKMPPGKLIPFPAGIAVIPGEHERLLVADNLSDDALLLDATTGEVLHRFDLSTHKIIPAEYPQSVAVTRDGKTGYVSLWNASAVAVLDLEKFATPRIVRLFPPASSTASGSHPTALLLGPDDSRLYVTLGNRDQVATIDTKTMAVRTLDTKLPGTTHLGAMPSALAQSADGKQLFVANAATNTVAFFDVSKTATRSPVGFIPTEWYPQALAVTNGELLIASGKGRGAGPNTKLKPGEKSRTRWPYILQLLHGSVARANIANAFANYARLTQAALLNNKTGAGGTKLFGGRGSPIKHVIYVIKENRSYDQLFGDIAGANGDASLVMFGEDITPNQHKLAREFGILDNFYDSGDVSGNGHDWSTAAIDSDYNEKTVQITYRGGERNYDYEGEVNGRIPMNDDMADVNETGTGYLWGNAARHRLRYRDYAEFISTHWCTDEEPAPSGKESSPDKTPKCGKKEIAKGEPLPAELGYGANDVSPWPWKMPLMASNAATKPELRGHFDQLYPGFNLEVPDQVRADEFLREFQQFVRDRDKGPAKALPNYVLIRMGNDHTSGTKPGLATPAASVADNDLAVGRIVDAVSHSPYWDDTAILVLEDDAQAGPDHVDGHRSIALVVSKYSPASAEKPFVDSQFYNTVSMIKTLESLLGLPPMNSNDANASPMASLFSGDGKHAPFTADRRNLESGLLYQVNPAKGPGAAASAMMDFSHADRADTATLNRILWENRMGDKPMPAPRVQRH